MSVNGRCRSDPRVGAIRPLGAVRGCTAKGLMYRDRNVSTAESVR
jgi:hypothetical protein